MDVAVVDPSGFTPPYDHHFCSGLANQGCQVTLYTSGEWDNWSPESYKRRNHFYRRTEQLSGWASSNSLRKGFKGVEHIYDMMRLLIQLRHRDPDIIHFQWLPIPLVDTGYVRALKRIAPTVFTVHDSNPFHGAPTSRIQLAGARIAPKTFDHLVVHTNTTKENLLKQGIPESSISVIPHGILRYPEQHKEISPVEWRSSNVNTRCEDSKCILFFGTLKPYKGLEVLLRAFAKLPSDTRDSVNLHIAGKPVMDVSSLRTMAADLNIEEQINWRIGFVPHEDVPLLFEQADMVVFPYREIDQSGALMTAIPFGTPIIASAIGGFNEVLTDGKHGRLVPPEDPKELSDALLSVISNPDERAKMGNAVQELAETTYSWVEIGSSYVELYEHLRSLYSRR